MSAALIAACLWVLIASVTAMLPMRGQFIPGVILLVTAPLLLIWIAKSVGVWVALLGLAGFLSMFRRPLLHLWARARGQTPEVPK
ncbi:DUF2484 family protein [Puniceibacterium sp. IMCC21224]|uniref:DUF2484 family protein n=1 Tax=Puniceibacterium sp. IMCC21224 TaxID=1618204 RepID=UPI00064DBDA2|nr:DUF2484 family protein [Puniceibacterium sp. IMCC21224]KMK67891.1 Protein of unknown function (DUF2484) [Puniceibacterium sp. IMCC21224]